MLAFYLVLIHLDSVQTFFNMDKKGLRGYCSAVMLDGGKRLLMDEGDKGDIARRENIATKRRKIHKNCTAVDCLPQRTQGTKRMLYGMVFHLPFSPVLHS